MENGASKHGWCVALEIINSEDTDTFNRRLKYISSTYALLLLLPTRQIRLLLLAFCALQFFTALHGRGLAMRILSVCLSVICVDCDKTEEKFVQIFIPYERSFSFLRRRMARGGRPLLSEMLGQPVPVGAKSPMLNRYFLVAPQP